MLTATSVLVVIVAAAVLAPILAPHDPNRQLDIVALKDLPPSRAFPFGTDPVSRDVLSRVLYGGRVSLLVGFLAALGGTVIGTAYGAIAGFTGGPVDNAMMRLVDAGMAVPRVLLILAVVALWGGASTPALILLLAATGWLPISRLVRAEVIGVSAREFAMAARALGVGRARTLVRHILPNVMSPVIVATTLSVGNVILLEAGLSFIGVGIQPPQASWGNIMQAGADRLVGLWWMSVFPGVAIVTTVMAINVLGDRLRDALDPRELPPR